MAGTTPDLIVFTPVTKATLDTLYTSNTVTITGLDSPVAISISGSGGQYSLNGGAYTDVPSVASTGDTVAVQTTSSNNPFIKVKATLIVGTGTPSDYCVTTLLNAQYFYDLLGLTSDDIPASVVEGFIAAWYEVYDSDCQVVYHTILSIYNWLIQKGNSEAIDGSRREKNNRREIEVKNSNSARNWQNALDNFTKSPWNLVPVCSVEFTGGNAALSRIIIGGTKVSEVNRVRENPDSYSQYDEVSPYSPNIRGRKVKKGFRF